MAKESEILLYGRKLRPKDCEMQAETIIKEYDKQTGLSLDKLDGSSLTTSIFGNSPHIYLNPTEHLEMGDFIQEGNRTLTVFGSGDFSLDAASKGTSEVLGFDINGYQYFVGALKRIAISKLSYEEYFNFFSNTKSNDFLNPEIYNKIKKGINAPNVFAFWDMIFLQRSREIANLKRNEIFLLYDQMANSNGNFFGLSINPEIFVGNSEYMFYEILCEMQGVGHSKIFRAIQGENGVKSKGSYMESEKTYNAAKERILDSKMGFLKANLFSLKKSLQDYKINSGFDVIYLSNIPDYLKGAELETTIDSQLMPLLNEDGQIVYCAQAIDLSEFTSKDKSLVADIRKSISPLHAIDIMSQTIRANSIEGYDILSDKYDISLQVQDTLTTDDTRGSSDIYVKVRKRS